MNNMFLDFYNALFHPNKILESSKNSFFIPILISILFILSPVFLYNPVYPLIEHFNTFKIRLLFFILFFSYLSAGIRLLFCGNDNKTFYYSYLSSVSPLIFGILGKRCLYLALIWSLILKTFVDFKTKSYFSLIVGLVFDVFLIYWLF
ncbi:MAG: hypothetical protein WBH84_03675 [Defluviitoga tunisiensis]|jgi:hypothetical protein|uniref:Uncharacterized protein n=1 Tax=Defluviitoga tunisiensis TaxID=1006576 RepID=A0A0C7NHK1_DEFTU|nr:hypothetical protein [Defluviitoga tunisiensis]MDD3601311.1 hypothetical protein [Defluviitoga tunisiensis]MDY0379997.1 hypothetical protein [Defluviitoga tunisiensis]CEP77456.1 hypothetical protein DTL3_0125 [Defluviitoga tunisiensis]HHV00833.1 hypothetical protein [Defluviitoga tunisiensis]HOB55098.1 hypothetical protein [Defluviitoga tunisiensis]